MKKGLVVLFFIALFFPYLAEATYHLQFFSVQNRVYENGNQVNRLVFDCVDANNNYPATDVLGTVVLTDPNGHNVDAEVNFGSNYSSIDGYYDANNGQWVYNAPYSYSYYWSIFSSQLIEGTYHLVFTDTDGEISEKDFQFNQLVDLPIIPSSSYSFNLDQAGNLIWKWQVPDYIDPSLKTSARAFIDFHDDQKKLIGELFVRIPTHMGFLSVPKSILDQILIVGKTFYLGTQIRTNDNNNRSYSGIGNN